MTGTAFIPSAGLLRIAVRAVFAITLAVGALVVTAPPGSAIPESTIQSECDEAGGTYTTTVVDGKRYSRCCYRDVNNNQHCDHYTDGTYTYTNLVDPGTPLPTTPPPREGVVGPPATVVEPAPQPTPRPGAVVGPPATEVQPTFEPRPGTIVGLDPGAA